MIRETFSFCGSLLFFSPPSLNKWDLKFLYQESGEEERQAIAINNQKTSEKEITETYHKQKPLTACNSNSLLFSWKTWTERISHTLNTTQQVGKITTALKHNQMAGRGVTSPVPVSASLWSQSRPHAQVHSRAPRLWDCRWGLGV
jgi:uncharacterized membrane protein